MLEEFRAAASAKITSGPDAARSQEYEFTVITLTLASARRVADAYARWRKGVHPAGLNLGDGFAYGVAKAHSCPLLYIGNDFAKTDIEPAL